MIACNSPPRRYHRITSRPDGTLPHGTIQPFQPSQRMYAADSASLSRHDGVRAERPAVSAAPRFRENRDDRDEALVVSEVHGVVRSFIHRDHYRAAPTGAWFQRENRNNSAVECGPSVPRSAAYTRFPSQGWAYSHPNAPYGTLGDHRTPQYWRQHGERLQGLHEPTLDRKPAPPQRNDRPPRLISVPRPPIAVPPPAAVVRLNEGVKRSLPRPPSDPVGKKAKGFDKLDLLCSATLDIGPLHDNPLGCSCPKSKCVALYCDCFKSGRRCDPKVCSCLSCKNTIAESGAEGARTRAIRCILARNPRAFTTAGVGNPLHKLPPGEVACNCIRSRCLKLYCSCFQAGNPCRDGVCTCVGCHNTTNDPDGRRKQAIQQCLEKRPDAFKTRVREKGLGCACKNNRCIRKYCECFRLDQTCTDKCSCRLCANLGSGRVSGTNASSMMVQDGPVEHSMAV